MTADEWGPLGPITQSPDDLMNIPIGNLAYKLITRARRLQRLEELERAAGGELNETIRSILKRERTLVRVAEIAARARTRELAMHVYRLSTTILK